jgi:hypothetical protein
MILKKTFQTQKINRTFYKKKVLVEKKDRTRDAEIISLSYKYFYTKNVFKIICIFLVFISLLFKSNVSRRG